MQQGANAYARVAQATQSPRELEAAILMKSAVRLQGIKEDWAGRKGDLEDALTYNRKLWTVLVGAVTQSDNPLPTEVKQNVANLGLFVFNHTVRLMGDPEPDRLDILVSINRDIAAGLRGIPPEGRA